MLGDTPAVSFMSTILTTLGSIVTSVAGMVATWVGVIFDEGNEIILLSCLLPLIFVGIRALKNLIRVKA